VCVCLCVCLCVCVCVHRYIDLDDHVAHLIVCVVCVGGVYTDI
jgi:hypothetical protein